MVEEVQGEVGTVAVCYSYHLLKAVAKTAFELFRPPSFCTEHKGKIYSLRYPRPVEPLVAVAPRLVKSYNM